MRRRLAPRQHRAIYGLDRDGFERRLLGLDVLANPGDGASRAHARNKNVGAAVGIVPDLGAGGFEVNLGIRRIIELLQHVAIGNTGENFFGFHDRAGHTARSGSKHELRAEREQKDAPLQTHRVGHHDHEFVSFDSRDECQTDARVPAGRLHQHRLAGMNFAGTLGLGNHAHADAILHAAQRVLAFQLGQNFGHAAFRDFVQADQGGVADQLRDVFGDFHDGLSWVPKFG